MDDLFARAARTSLRHQPLAERMRPRRLDDVVGQDALLGPNGTLSKLLRHRTLPSLILWGPPGTGKTSLAGCLAEHLGAALVRLSAVSSGVAQLREAVDKAGQARDQYGRRTLLFIDEIHRFNKAQQDALLPHVESGTVTLCGATTENPAFEINAALLSRCMVAVLKPLTAEALATLVRGALADAARGLGQTKLQVAADALTALCQKSDGDARRALSYLEAAAALCQSAERGDHTILLDDVEAALACKILPHDKAGDAHHHLISAFIKSMRGTDPDAAVYYLARLLRAGESPHFLLRRMVIFASEDIGNACPAALQVATAALQAFDMVGLPEGTLPLTQAATYLAMAPKSNSVIKAYARADEMVQAHGALPVPKHLRPASTRLGRSLGHGTEYAYPHDFPEHFVAQAYLPEAVQGHIIYAPSDQGDERITGARLVRARQARQDARPEAMHEDV